MKRSKFKRTIARILLGTFLFFTWPILLTVLLLKFIFTPFGMGRMGMFRRHEFAHTGMYGRPGFGFADKIRSMSDEEYEGFKRKMQESRCGKLDTGY